MSCHKIIYNTFFVKFPKRYISLPRCIQDCNFLWSTIMNKQISVRGSMSVSCHCSAFIEVLKLVFVAECQLTVEVLLNTIVLVLTNVPGGQNDQGIQPFALFLANKFSLLLPFCKFYLCLMQGLVWEAIPDEEAMSDLPDLLHEQSNTQEVSRCCIYSSGWSQSGQLCQVQHAALSQPVGGPDMVQDGQPWQQVWYAKLAEYSLDRRSPTVYVPQAVQHATYILIYTTVTATSNKGGSGIKFF